MTRIATMTKYEKSHKTSKKGRKRKKVKINKKSS